MPATLALLLALAAPSGEPGDRGPLAAHIRRVARHPGSEIRLVDRAARDLAAHPPLGGLNPNWGTAWPRAARFGHGGGPMGLGFAGAEGQTAAQRLGLEKAKEHDVQVRSRIGPIVKQLQLQVSPK
jgi:hypothetical protein